MAAYAFDEGAGPTVTDFSGNGNTGTITAATWTTGGRYGKALSFNGANSWIVINDAPSLRLTTAMTLEAWVKASTGSTDWSDIIYKGNDNYYLMASTPNGGAPALGGIFGGSTYGEVFGSGALPLNTWTHLAGTYDGTMERLYINGVEVASRSQSGSLITTSNPLQIGGDSFYGQYFNGLIDEVRVYNRALSSSEIQADMTTPLTSSAANTAPTVSTIPSQTINEDNSTGPITISIGDSETPPANLTLSGASSNLSLVPTANIIFGGAGTNRTVTVTPLPNQNGTAGITVTVSDGALTASSTFMITVNSVNDAPTISNVTDQSISEDSSTGTDRVRHRRC